MRRTLYRKLILIYVILAIAGFTLISTVGSRMVEDSLVSSASTSLYREATQIASKQGDLYYHSERSLTDLYNSLSALASYHNSQIWLISADGEILLNTAAALDEENPEIIDGFDPVALVPSAALSASARPACSISRSTTTKSSSTPLRSPSIPRSSSASTRASKSPRIMRRSTRARSTRRCGMSRSATPV